MRRAITVALAALAIAGASPAWAQPVEVDTHGLTPEQVHQLQVTADQAKAAASQNAPAAQAQRISQYAEIGKGIAEALGAAAKELNVAVNDFAKTPVGQLTMWLIIYKVVGHDVIHIAFFSLWIIVSLSVWSFYFSKLWTREETIEYFETGKKKQVTRSALRLGEPMDSYRIIGVAVGAACVALGLIMFPW